MSIVRITMIAAPSRQAGVRLVCARRLRSSLSLSTWAGSSCGRWHDLDSAMRPTRSLDTTTGSRAHFNSYDQARQTWCNPTAAIESWSLLPDLETPAHSMFAELRRSSAAPYQPIECRPAATKCGNVHR